MAFTTVLVYRYTEKNNINKHTHNDKGTHSHYGNIESEWNNQQYFYQQVDRLIHSNQTIYIVFIGRA